MVTVPPGAVKVPLLTRLPARLRLPLVSCTVAPVSLVNVPPTATVPPEMVRRLLLSKLPPTFKLPPEATMVPSLFRLWSTWTVPPVTSSCAPDWISALPKDEPPAGTKVPFLTVMASALATVLPVTVPPLLSITRLPKLVTDEPSMLCAPLPSKVTVLLVPLLNVPLLVQFPLTSMFPPEGMLNVPPESIVTLWN